MAKTKQQKHIENVITVDPLNKANEKDVKQGAELHALHVAMEKWGPEDAAEDYSITDAIVALMHFAAHKGFDVKGIIRSAQGHFEAERTECPVCGQLEDPDQHECEFQDESYEVDAMMCGPDFDGDVVDVAEYLWRHMISGTRFWRGSSGRGKQ